MKSIKTFREFLNENLWADLQDRSSGEVIRKEDIIATREELDEIIKSAYKEQGKGDTLTLDFTGKKILVDDLSYLFYDYNNVKHILGLETWDVSNMTNMKHMFSYCTNLTELDLSNWDVSQVENMALMFAHCYKLTELNIGNWNTSRVTNMSGMFDGCYKLTELHIENWDVSNVTNMSAMFENCENLTKLDNIGKWVVGKVTDMNWMFGNCEKLLELDLRNWDVSLVKDMSHMFYNCENLKELNLENWDVSNITMKQMPKMFYACPVQYIKKENKLIRK